MVKRLPDATAATVRSQYRQSPPLLYRGDGEWQESPGEMRFSFGQMQRGCSHVGCALRTFTVTDVGNPTNTDSGGNIAVVLKPIAITEIANGARCAPYEFLAR